MERYACILWRIEKTYSCVKIKTIIHNLESNSDIKSLVGNWYNVRYSSDEPPQEASVIGVGSRAKMSKLAADLASEDAERSLLENEADLPRTRSKKESGEATTSRAATEPVTVAANEDKENENALSGKLAKKSKKRKRETTGCSANELVTEPPNEHVILPQMTETVAENVAEAVTVAENVAATLAENVAATLAENVAATLAENVATTVAETVADQSIALEYQDENRMGEKDERIRQLKARNEYQRKRIRNLERQLCEQNFQDTEVQGEQERIKLADGIYVSKSVIRDLKVYYRSSPGSFLRRLLEKGGLFTLEEIPSSSVQGKPSSHGSTRNPLDPVKFKAAKDYTIKKCGLKPGTVQMFSFEKRIVNICTDARKKLKRRGPSSNNN